MCAAAALATDPANPPRRPVIPDDDSIERLEKLIDKLEETIPKLNSFILPGGGDTASYCHIARCVCRRAERAVVQLASTEEVPPVVTRLLNRTSDFLFVLARYVAQVSGSEEVKWIY